MTRLKLWLGSIGILIEGRISFLYTFEFRIVLVPVVLVLKLIAINYILFSFLYFPVQLLEDTDI